MRVHHARPFRPLCYHPALPGDALTNSDVPYTDLRDFIAMLEREGELKRIATSVDPRFEITEICDRVLKRGGPALLFEHPKSASSTMPVLANLFGTPRLVALGMGQRSVE